IMSTWNLDAYIGIFVNEQNDITLVISRVADFPVDLFPLAVCWPMRVSSSGNYNELSVSRDVRFVQEDGKIIGFAWKMDAKIGKLHFQRSMSEAVQQLCYQNVSLLRVPGEIRNKIYEYFFEERHLWIGGTATDVAIKPVVNPGTINRTNRIQYVCRQLWQETRGLEMQDATLFGVQDSFSNLIELRDPLLSSRIRKVELSGFNRLVTKRNTDSLLFPIIDFCFAEPQANVRLEIE
ncbi:hypothetical protein EK21DRAFT_27439, partial [Setomelanomma holmii]